MRVLLLLGLLPWAAVAADPARQQELYAQLAARTAFAAKTEDAEGNIIQLVLNHAKTFRDKNPGAPGLRDADLEVLSEFPRLEAVTLQAQPLSQEGLSRVTSLPGLVCASLCDLNQDRKDGIDPTWDFLRPLATQTGLRVLDLTHSFFMPAGGEYLDALPGFPKLHTVVLDVGLSTEGRHLVDFIRRCPSIERLKLHRTTLSEAEFAEILDALPKLRVLEVKPAGNTPGDRWSYRSLRLVAAHPQITVLRLLHADALPLPWEDGLEHLVGATKLTYVGFPTPVDDDVTSLRVEDLARLAAARPDLTISSAAKIIKRPDDHPLPYAWEIGPR